MRPVVVPEELEPEPEPTVPPLVPVLLALPVDERPDPEPELAVASVVPLQPAHKAQTTTPKIPRALMGAQYARCVSKCSSDARKSVWGKPPHLNPSSGLCLWRPSTGSPLTASW